MTSKQDMNAMQALSSAQRNRLPDLVIQKLGTWIKEYHMGEMNGPEPVLDALALIVNGENGAASQAAYQKMIVVQVLNFQIEQNCKKLRMGEKLASGKIANVNLVFQNHALDQVI